MTLQGLFADADYWMQRYETLVTGFVISGSFLAVGTPLRRLLRQSRKQLNLGYYSVLTTAINLLELGDYPEAKGRDEYLVFEGEKLSLQFLDQQHAYFLQLRSSLLAVALQTADREIVETEMRRTLKLFEEVYFPYAREGRWQEILNNQNNAGRTELWIWTVEVPSRAVRSASKNARLKLDQRRTALIEQLR